MAKEGLYWRNIIVLFLFFVSIIIGSWYVFDDFPTFEKSMIIFLLILIVFNILNIRDTKTRMKFIDGRFNRIENSFIKLTNDFKEHIKHKK